MKPIKISVVVIALLVLSTITVFAQALGPPPSGGSTSGPIDGGVVSLLIGVAAYGYRKLKADNNKEQ